MRRDRARVLLVGMGGLGCPAALALVRAKVTHLGLCDDDAVDRSNLHRQILFGEADVGRPKIEAASDALRAVAAKSQSGELSLTLHATRLLPTNAVEIVRQYDLVLEGADNYATKFLAADACALAGVAVVHASAVRWVGTALAVGARARPCYRCLFEDVPGGAAATCAEAGVMGPVVGVVAAAQVDFALSWIDGLPVDGQLVTFDGRADELRKRTIRARPECPLCGHLAAPARIERIESERYASPAFAG